MIELTFTSGTKITGGIFYNRMTFDISPVRLILSLEDILFRYKKILFKKSGFPKIFKKIKKVLDILRKLCYNSARKKEENFLERGTKYEKYHY